MPVFSERRTRHHLMATVGAVAYERLSQTVFGSCLAADADLSEMKMFGGLALLVGGNMAVAASGQGRIMVRVDPASSGNLVATTEAHLVEMRGRPMQGRLRLNTNDVRTRNQLARWVQLGTPTPGRCPRSGRRARALACGTGRRSSARLRASVAAAVADHPRRPHVEAGERQTILDDGPHLRCPSCLGTTTSSIDAASSRNWS